MDYIIVFFIFIIFLVLIIYGLPYQKSSFNQQIAQEMGEKNIRENFETSGQQDIEEGASTFYDWAVLGIDGKKHKKHRPPHHHREPCNGKDCLDDSNQYIQNDYYIYPTQKEHIIHEKPDCGKCDATKCQNINRYVLKTSVPPCPDMSKYALKSMIPNCPDMNEYIKKSEIPACKKCPDMRDYVRKSEVPACPRPVVCPECPVCPPSYRDIQDDPRFHNWLLKYEHEVDQKIDRYYVPKQECKKENDRAYQRGLEEGRSEAYKNIAQEAGRDISNTREFKKCLSHFKGDDHDRRKEEKRREEEKRHRERDARRHEEERRERESRKHKEEIRDHFDETDHKKKMRNGTGVYEEIDEEEVKKTKDGNGQYSSWGCNGKDSRNFEGCNYSGWGFPMDNGLYMTSPVC